MRKIKFRVWDEEERKIFNQKDVISKFYHLQNYIFFFYSLFSISFFNIDTNSSNGTVICFCCPC